MDLVRALEEDGGERREIQVGFEKALLILLQPAVGALLIGT